MTNLFHDMINLSFYWNFLLIFSCFFYTLSSIIINWNKSVHIDCRTTLGIEFQNLRDGLLRSKRAVKVLTGTDAATVRKAIGHSTPLMPAYNCHVNSTRGILFHWHFFFFTFNLWTLLQISPFPDFHLTFTDFPSFVDSNFSFHFCLLHHRFIRYHYLQSHLLFCFKTSILINQTLAYSPFLVSHDRFCTKWFCILLNL